MNTQVSSRWKEIIQNLEEFFIGKRIENKKDSEKVLPLSEEDLLVVSTRYFYIGFAFLPWIWVVNYFYLAPITRDFPDLNKKIKQCM